MNWKDENFKELMLDEYAIIGRLQKVKDWYEVLDTNARQVVSMVTTARQNEENEEDDEVALQWASGITEEALTTIIESCEELRELMHMVKDKLH